MKQKHLLRVLLGRNKRTSLFFWRNRRSEPTKKRFFFSKKIIFWTVTLSLEKKPPFPSTSSSHKKKERKWKTRSDVSDGCNFSSIYGREERESRWNFTKILPEKDDPWTSRILKVRFDPSLSSIPFPSLHRWPVLPPRWISPLLWWFCVTSQVVIAGLVLATEKMEEHQFKNKKKVFWDWIAHEAPAQFFCLSLAEFEIG